MSLLQEYKQLQELAQNLIIFKHDFLPLHAVFTKLVAIDAGNLAPQALCPTLGLAVEGLQKSGEAFKVSHDPTQVSEAVTLSAPLQDQAWRFLEPGEVLLAGCQPGKGALYNHYIDAAVARQRQYLQQVVILLHSVAHQSSAGSIFDPPLSNRGACGNHWYTDKQGRVVPGPATGICSTGASRGSQAHTLMVGNCCSCALTQGS